MLFLNVITFIYFIYFRLRTTQFYVVLGQHSTNHPAGHEEEYFVSKIILHNEFDHHNYHNDIALVKLNRRVRFSKHIRPVCIPTKGKCRLSNVIMCNIYNRREQNNNLAICNKCKY